MRVYDSGVSRSTDAIAFEIGAWLGRRRTAKVVAAIPGVRMLRWPRLILKRREEVFCEFELMGERFNVWEPFGVNSRFWIGPSNGQRTPALKVVRQAFVNYHHVRFPWFRKWVRSVKGLS